MSTINKIPYISKVLGSLSDTELSVLSVLMNGGGDQNELLRIWGYAQGNRTPITSADKGVHLCSLQVGPTLYRGYLLYTNEHCTLVHFTDFQTLSMFELDLENNLLKTVSEYLDINELRTEVFKLSFKDGGGEGTGTELAKAIIEGSVISVEFSETLDSIRPYIFNELPALTSATFGDISNGIGENAFANCENLHTLKLGTINGKIDSKAFYGLINVSSFELDADSNITELGINCFSGIGMERNSAERLVFDFRNSTFTAFQGFGTAGQPGSMDSGTGEIIGGTPGLGLFNATIRLPSTVVSFGESSDGGFSSQSGSGGILNSSENVDLFLLSQSVIPLANLEFLPNDAQSHIFVPYNMFGEYSVSTNWSALSTLAGYAPKNSIPANQNLPIMDSEGYELGWYSDINKENSISVSNGNEMYCYRTGNRLYSKVVLGNAMFGTVTITDSNSNTYNLDELIQIGTEITITPVAEDEGIGEPLTSFKVNGVDYTSTGSATIIVGSDTVVVDVVYKYEYLPDYFEVEEYYNSGIYAYVKSINIKNNGSAELWTAIPENLVLRRYYLSPETNELMQIDEVHDYMFVKSIPNAPSNYHFDVKNIIIEEGYIGIGNNAFEGLTSLLTITVPSSLIQFAGNVFYGCNSLTKVDLSNTQITILSNYVFFGCSSLNEIKLPEGLLEIYNYCFGNCSSLTSINLPSTVTNFGNGTFYNSGITSITIPEGVQYIFSECFSNCINLTSITLPSTLLTIDVQAFSSTGLTSITIPEGFQYFSGDNCFEFSNSIGNNFNYEGTMDEFSTIVGNSVYGWNNNASFSIVHCSDGDYTL